MDILSAQAGKGAALAYVLDMLRRAGLAPSAGVQVSGDSGNDAELLEVPGVKVRGPHACVCMHAYWVCDDLITKHM